MIERAGKKLHSADRRWLIAAASLVVSSFAQTPAPPPASAPPLVATAAAPPAFEVTTVKRNKSGGSGSHSNFVNGRFTGSNILLKNLMQYQAYGIPEPRILGGPKWLSSERFDIEAKTDSSVADQLRTLGRDRRRLQTQAMFQQLLADRFKLIVHWETRNLPVYALVVTGNAPGLHALKQSDASPTRISTSTGQFTAEGVTMAEMAQALTQELSSELSRVVVDRTGLAGRYDVTLKWTPDTGSAPVNSGTEGAQAPDSGPSIFTAIREQLGLRLESTKGPVQVLLIDHVEMPSEN